MMTQTAVAHVLPRLRSLLPVARSLLVVPLSAPRACDDSFGCSICFPHRCSCGAEGETAGAAKADSATQPHGATAIRRPRAASARNNNARHADTTSALEPKALSVAAAKQRALSAAQAQQQQQQQQQSQSRSADAAVGACGLSAGGVCSAMVGAASVGTCSACGCASPSASRTTAASNALNACRFCRIITPAELAARNSLDNGLWICIAASVYDLTAWASHHPGGLLPLLDTAGSDCTDVFRVFHSEEVMRQRLPPFHVGVMGDFDKEGKMVADKSAWGETPMQKDFHAMIRQMEQDGQFVTDFGWYWKKVFGLAMIFASAWVLLYLAMLPGASWWFYPASALALGLFWQQVAFMGHDLGHNSVRGSVAKDWAPGLLVTVLFGVSVQWWKRSHNVHHVVTNSLSDDCDIQYLPVFALSEKMLAPGGFFSTYHARQFVFTKFSSWLVAYQHWLYWPVMGIARANLYVQSLGLVWDETKAVPHRNAEKLGLAAFWAWHLLVLWLLPGWWTRLVYYSISHWTAGLTHVQITLSHFAMPVHEDSYSPSSAPEKREHFLRSQFATTMDVACPRWLDWLHGGLQFQLTHHLLPRVPRHALRTVRERYVKPFALRHGLVYAEETFLDANITVWERMKTAAMASRQVSSSNPLPGSFLWQFMNSEG